MEVLQRPTSSTIVSQAITLYDLLRNPDHVLAQRKNDSYEILEVKYFSFSVFSHLFKPMTCETVRNQPPSRHKYSKHFYGCYFRYKWMDFNRENSEQVLLLNLVKVN